MFELGLRIVQLLFGFYHRRSYQDSLPPFLNHFRFTPANRIRTSIACHCLLLLICIFHTSTSQTSSEIAAPLDTNEPKQTPSIVTAMQTYRQGRAYRRGDHDDHDYQDDHDDHDDHSMMKEEGTDMKAMTQPKVDYWGGYYDFLINEGSYKFWAVFQLATAALLIYSGFAALYYAKVNPPTIDDEFDDIFRRRRRRSVYLPAQERSFCGLDSATYQRIVDAVAREIH
ncbi:uncharacterized protein LOC143186679 [Calliopsis andreniformis]|uniref:uncharacterized protein LOC143186679 n=1 Tax=Calliopsis andreniformis TaxID=337506 RepID=UPI003FCDA0EA